MLLHSFGKKKNKTNKQQQNPHKQTKKEKVPDFTITFGWEVLFLCLFEILLSIQYTIMFQFLRAIDIYSVPFYLGHHKQLSDNKSHSLNIICYQKGSSRSTCTAIQDISCFVMNAIKSFTKSVSFHLEDKYMSFQQFYHFLLPVCLCFILRESLLPCSSNEYYYLNIENDMCLLKDSRISAVNRGLIICWWMLRYHNDGCCIKPEYKSPLAARYMP